MTRAEAKEFSNDLTKFLAEMSKKYDMKLQFRSVRFSDTTVSCTVRGESKSGEAKVLVDKLAVQAASNYLAMFGVKVSSAELLSKNFVVGKDVFKFVSYNSRAKKYPLIMQKGDSQYKLNGLQLKYAKLS